MDSEIVFSHVADFQTGFLYGDLTGVFHKVVGPQFPDEIAEVDGKADVGQNGHLEETQPLKIGARAPMAPTKRRGIHRELKRLPKGTPSCAVPATARAMTHRNSAEMTASATRLKALKIWSISSEACEYRGWSIKTKINEAINYF